MARLKYLQFREFENTGKTTTWRIYNGKEHFLGVVKWYPPWRRYVFRAAPIESLFDAACLQEIVDFITEQMELRKQKAPIPDG